MFQVIGFNTIRQDSDPYFHHALLYSCHSPPPQALDPSLRDGFECGDYTMSFLMHCFHAVAIAAVGRKGSNLRTKNKRQKTIVQFNILIILYNIDGINSDLITVLDLNIHQKLVSRLVPVMRDLLF